MRKKVGISLLIILGVFCVCLTACGKSNKIKTKSTEENNEPIEAMYVPFGEENYIFFDRSTESPFYAIIPEDELYDTNDKKIKQKDLSAGDIIACYGDGKMLESYPGQYPGVVKMVRVQKGTVEDTKKYEKEVAQFARKPGKADIPYLDIENMQKDALATTAATEGNYEWKYKDSSGNEQIEVVDNISLSDKGRLADVICDGESSDLKLIFSAKPNHVKVRRWAFDEDRGQNPYGQRVRVTLDGNVAHIKRAKRMYIYEVTATWDNGSVHYGFYIP